MEWFSVWWDALSLAQQILFCIALPATLILLIQMIMLILGFGGGGEGIDFSDTSGLDADTSGMDLGDAASSGDFGDGSAPGDFSVASLFSVQGIVSFLCVFGWSGLTFIGSGIFTVLSLVIAFVLGFATMFAVAYIIRMSAKLAQNGTFNINNLLGATATVYVSIPSAGNGRGKVMVQLSERYLEYDAITEEEESLQNNTAVRVTDILSGNVLVVETLSNNN